jgi:hypothetical protein
VTHPFSVRIGGLDVPESKVTTTMTGRTQMRRRRH